MAATTALAATVAPTMKRLRAKKFGKPTDNQSKRIKIIRGWRRLSMASKVTRFVLMPDRECNSTI
jgi:hypothetical protein